MLQHAVAAIQSQHTYRTNMSSKRELKIKINGGTEVNLLTTYDLYLIDAPFIMWGSLLKDYDTISFIEEDGIEIYNKTTLKEFDYEVRLCYFGPQAEANPKINAFMKSLFQITSNQLTANRITIINDFHNQVMIGYPKTTSVDSFEITEDGNVVTIFDFTIIVDKPLDCIY